MDIGAWADMMPHTITIEPFVSRDTYGAATYGAAVTYKARVQGKNRLITTLSGDEKVSTVTVYVGSTSITPEDRLTLPASFSPTIPNILDVQPVSDESGHHHQVIYA